MTVVAYQELAHLFKIGFEKNGPPLKLNSFKGTITLRSEFIQQLAGLESTFNLGYPIYKFIDFTGKTKFKELSPITIGILQITVLSFYQWIALLLIRLKGKYFIPAIQ